MSSRTGHPWSGFALVELVLVVAIMGIIGAIAIPKLSGATARAKDSSMSATVAQLQRAVDLYTAEHADLSPVTEPDGSTTTSGATLIQRLTRYTDDRGNAGGSGVFGPYLRNWPVNLHNAKQTIRIDGAAAGANTHGWRIDSATLKVEADQLSAVSIIGQGKAVMIGGKPVAISE